MIKVLFTIKKTKVKSSGECPIYAKVILGHKSTLISTGKNISEERWTNSNKLRNLLKNEKEKVLKQSLDLLLVKIERTYNELSRLSNEVNLEELKEIISGNKKDNTVNLLTIFDKHNEDFKKRVASQERSSASLQKYMRSKDLIKAFLKKKYNITDIDIKKVSGAFIYNLEFTVLY